MKGIILAAGRGSRMGHLTGNQPKCMTPLGGKPLLHWQLEGLRGAGITEIAVVRGYLADTFTLPLHYFSNPRWATTNMVISLAQARPWLTSVPCIVSYSDICYQSASVRRLLDANADIAITYDPNWRDLWELRFSDPLADAETFRIDTKQRLLDIGGKTTRIEEIQGQYMGLLRFTPPGWQRVEDLLLTLDPAAADRLDMTTLLRSLLDAGVEIEAIPVAEPWFEVDSESDLKLYEERFFSRNTGQRTP